MKESKEIKIIGFLFYIFNMFRFWLFFVVFWLLGACFIVNLSVASQAEKFNYFSFWLFGSSVGIAFCIVVIGEVTKKLKNYLRV